MLILPQLLLTVSLKETVLLLVKVITFLGQVKILLPGSWHRCLWGCPWRWGWPTCCCWWSGCCSWWRKQNKLTLPQSHCWRRRESNRGKRERDGLRTRNLAGTATAEWWLMMCIFSNILISLSNIANLQSDRVITPSIWDQWRGIHFCKNCWAFIVHTVVVSVVGETSFASLDWPRDVYISEFRYGDTLGQRDFRQLKLFLNN